MARRNQPRDEPKTDANTEPVFIEYRGPVDQTSHVFGALEVGRRYQAEPELAAYLCRTSPEYWKPASE